MTTQENYNRWLNSNKIDAQVKAQLKAMSKEDSYTGFSVGSFFLIVALFFTFFFGWCFG